MASNLFSRLLPPASGSPSVYEALRADEEVSDASDIEERAGMTMLDEENLGNHDFQLDPALAEAMGSQITVGESPTRAGTSDRDVNPTKRAKRWLHHSRRGAETDDADDEVPLSLLVEERHNGAPTSPQSTTTMPEPSRKPNPIPVPGRATEAVKAKWRATQEQQRLYQDPHIPQAFGVKGTRKNGLMSTDPKEKAMWRWANVQNLDNFLQDVYDYFLGNGFWSIILGRILNLSTVAFVVGFGTFLTFCIDYKSVPGSKEMSQVLIPQCTKNMSGFANLVLWLIALLWIWKVFQYIMDFPRLRHMHDFYLHLLEIPDTDIQTISWQDIVKRLMDLRDANPSTAANVTEGHRRFIGTQSKQRMDAHDIANRLMRRDNYLIALFNKDILDLTLPIPFLQNRPLFSKTLEWNLNLCILSFVFDERGQIRSMFLKDSHRRSLSDSLRRRFFVAGVMNVVCAPFIIVYFMMLYFFRYFNEYQKNPSQISSRQYTPFAEWKFREFNELWHLFERRINMSYPFASRYINQFPKDKTVQLSRFVAFVTGALASVLALASIIDPELFLGFEITPERTVLFYLGLFGSVWAVARGVAPEENLVFDPEFALTHVVEYTHYLPNQWRGRLHSDEVRKEFALLYQMKVVIFLEELLSIIFTPFILWYSLPPCSDRIIDFFREFTIHVDGLGYVCSFAVFDFKNTGNRTAQQHQSRGTDGADLRDDYYSTKDGKMLASYFNFMDNYVTNPKPGVPYLHPSRKAHFHPPPSFPGLASSTLMGGMQASGAGKINLPDRQPRTQSRQRTPRFAPIPNQHSPVTSILLDPQHQPGPSSFKPLSKTGTQSRLRASLKPPVELSEDNEEPNTYQGPDGEGAAEAGEVCESNLGESWKTTRAGATDEDDEDGAGAQTASGDKGPGVLGMVYQFSKAHTEGRGTGVNI